MTFLIQLIKLIRLRAVVEILFKVGHKIVLGQVILLIRAMHRL